MPRGTTATAAGTTGPTRSRRRTTCGGPSTGSATTCSPARRPARRAAPAAATGRRRHGRRGLDDMLRRVREQRRELREQRPARRHARGGAPAARHRRRPGARRAVPRPVRRRPVPRGELDALPSDTARAVRQLESYDWRSPEARADLRADQGPAAPRGARHPVPRHEAGAGEPRPGGDAARSRTCSPTSTRCSTPTRGASTRRSSSTSSWQKYGDMFPDNPRDLEELVDSLARRAAAAERMMQSLSPQQREELAALMAGALEDMDLAARDGPARRGAARRADPTSTGAAGSGCAATSRWAWATRPARCRTSPTSTSSSRRSARTTPAPASRTSTRRPSAARSGRRRRRRRARAAAARARARGAGLPQPRPGGRLELTAEGGPPARADRAAPRLRRPARRRAAAATTCTTRARPAS